MSLFLLAEIGINHNGSLDIARQLIAAAAAGFDAVKFPEADGREGVFEGAPRFAAREPVGNHAARAEDGPGIQPRAVPGDRPLLQGLAGTPSFSDSLHFGALVLAAALKT